MATDQDALRGALKRLPSRDRIDDMHRIAMTIPDPIDAVIIDTMADLLMDIRHAVRGGRRDIRGSRHWDLGQ